MKTLQALRNEDKEAFQTSFTRFLRCELPEACKGLEGFYVYFIFEKEPDLFASPVYVGCTGSLYWRMVKHTHKIGLTSVVYALHFESKAEALKYEKRCIRVWKPAINVKYVNRHQLALLE